MSARAESWQTEFFGSASRPLLGCYHPPARDRVLGCGVVLIHSINEEYIKFHRALRQLAVTLAEMGFSVFRFDLSCCGDSTGHCEDGEIERWLEDIETAIAELRLKSGVSRLALVGLRIGGALAAMTGAARGDFDALVLWDPVVSGKEYLDELGQLHNDMLRFAHVIPDESALSGAEVLGFALSERTRDSVSRVDLHSVPACPARRILVVESNENCPQRGLCDHLEALNADVVHRRLPAPELWAWLEDFSKVLVPQAILQSMSSWLEEPYR